jgi:hypothetical protein
VIVGVACLASSLLPSIFHHAFSPHTLFCSVIRV